MITTLSALLGEDKRSIHGRVVDSKTGDGLIGANVVVLGTSIGTATDLNGGFILENIPMGIIELKATYIGYKPHTASNIEISGFDIPPIEIRLNSDVVHIEGVNVRANRVAGGQVESITKKQNAIEVQDNISSAQISKSGDSNVADAMRRVSSVTIMDDKFLIVRGLGDRYSSAQLNSVGMPSPEPEKRAIPLDIFSTAMIKSIDVAKSYRPDLPGTFGGGNVNIKTKIYPDRTIYRLKTGSSISSNLLPGESFVSNMDGKNDWFGYDRGERVFPSSYNSDIVQMTCCPPEFMENLTDDYYWQYDTTSTVFGTKIDSSYIINQDSLHLRELLWKQTQYPKNGEFAPVYTNKIVTSGLPSSLGVTAGTKIEFNENWEGGFLLDGNFSSKYSHNTESKIRYAAKNTSLEDTTKILIPDDIQLIRNTFKYATNLGINASAGIAFRQIAKVGVRSVYTHSSKDEYNRFKGRSGEIDENGLFINQYYNEKSININTLTANSLFNIGGISNNIELNYTKGRSLLYEPYTIKHQYQLDESVGLYKVYARNAVEPGEIYSSIGQEKSTSFTYDHEASSYLGEFKFGVNTDRKTRQFDRRQLLIRFSDYESEIDPSKLYIADESKAGSQFNQLASVQNGEISEGYIFTEQTSTGKGTKNTDAYNANENIHAYYLMYNHSVWNKKIQISGGVRQENYSMSMAPRHPVTNIRPFYTELLETPQGTVKDTTYIEFSNSQNNLLPSLTINYHISEKAKIRSSISKTIARAQFREYAPYEYQQFFTADVAIGYPFLENTTIHNYDLRWDYFPGGLENISVGVFYKEFDKPIEESIVAAFGRSYYQTWQNAENATLLGLESEFRKSLKFIPARFGFLSINTNVSLSRSEVISPDSSRLYVAREGASSPDVVSIFNRVTDKIRPLQGQSNFVFNFGIYYKTPKGAGINIVYNTFSPRLVALSGDVAGSYWEMPFHSANLVMKKKIGPIDFNFKIKNLLNSNKEFGHYFNGEYYTTKKYEPGRTFSIGVSYSN